MPQPGSRPTGSLDRSARSGGDFGLGGALLCASLPAPCALPHFPSTPVHHPRCCELAPQLTHLTGGETEARGIYMRESSSVSRA